MKKLLVWVALLTAFHFSSSAQGEESADRLKVNLGVACGFSISEMNEVNLKNLLYRGKEENLANHSSWHIEFTSDFLPARERISFATGLRFTNQYAWLEKPFEDLYWLVKEEDKTSDYVTLHSLSQSNYYLGIPLSFRVFFNSEERRVRPYLKLEACFDLKIATRNEVDFHEERMRRLYEDQITDEIGKPEKFRASAASSIGIRINCNKFYVAPELTFPKFELTDSPISFIKNEDSFISAELKVAVQFPIGRDSKPKATAVESSYSSDIQQENTMPNEDF